MKKLNDYSNKTDLEIIEIYKNNAHWKTKQEIETYFYKKYSPLCKKYSNLYRHISSMEDNMQECYFLMIKALDYVDTNKITNTSLFSFGSIFRFHITSHFIHENVRKVKEFNHLLSENDLDYYINHSTYIRSNSYKNNVTCIENKIIFNTNLEIFKKQLTSYELNLLELLQTSMKKQDVAKELGEKHTANLTYWRSKIQSKYIEFMNNVGYELTI